MSYPEGVTGLLQTVLKRVEALPAPEQDAIASQILATLDEEESWHKFFVANRDKFAELADEALAEHRRGETRPAEELLGE